MALRDFPDLYYMRYIQKLNPSCSRFLVFETLRKGFGCSPQYYYRQIRSSLYRLPFRFKTHFTQNEYVIVDSKYRSVWSRMAL
jgi:hypothetical protein